MSRHQAGRARQAGFTLIELMAVVMIIGILAKVAIPVYQDYITRARVTEGFALAETAQHAVAEYYGRWGVLPPDNASSGLPQADSLRGRWVASVQVTGGTVAVRFRNDSSVVEDLRGKSLYLWPATNATYPSASIVWLCDRKRAPAGFTVAGGESDNPLPSKTLPGVCR